MIRLDLGWSEHRSVPLTMHHAAYNVNEVPPVTIYTSAILNILLTTRPKTSTRSFELTICPGGTSRLFIVLDMAKCVSDEATPPTTLDSLQPCLPACLTHTDTDTHTLHQKTLTPSRSHFESFPAILPACDTQEEVWWLLWL